MRIWLGYDPREAVATSVLAHSIQRRAKRPVSIAYLSLSQLPDFRRPRDALQSTDFAFTRFLVPLLEQYRPEPVLFMDSDMLMLADVGELFDLFDERYAVQVVKHQYVPQVTSKFLDQPQTFYRRKNWSSLMLFNPPRCRSLSMHYVSTAHGLDLHQFKWLEGEHEIGALPKSWNYLVSEENQCDVGEVRNVHFTQGGPWFEEYDGCEFSRCWHLERDDMLRADQRPSVQVAA